MNNKIKNTIIFITGAAIGSVVTWQYTKKKYEQLAQDEIDSVKEVFGRSKAMVDLNKQSSSDDNVLEIDRLKAKQAKEKADVSEYAAELVKRGYVNYSNVKDEEEIDEKKDTSEYPNPYVIPPEEFGELDDYDTISMDYYADNILVDDNDEIVEDVEALIGFESLTHFGEFEDDSVFIRNERLKIDFEILSDQRKYSELYRNRAELKPHHMED